MASAISGIWAIDLGSNSLKALRLRESDTGVEVIGFDYIEFPKVLSGGGVSDEEKVQILTDSLHKFTSRNDVSKDEVAISIPGHNSFSRFIKLPPVEQKRVSEIVQFEAVQQIPFDINEVEWDWQLMDNPDSPDTEVGIFAIKNEVIDEVMTNFANEGMKVTCVQILPMALYNYLHYDRSDLGGANEKATVILDMGAENTTLVVCTKSTVWQRSIRIGGNAFTEAVAEKFHLSFQKAEKLKRTAPMSKYVRQIFSAMKPVYTDLGSEVQRSLGFYSSSSPGREKGFARIIAIGGGMKLKGLSKYLQQTLGVPVIMPDAFERVSVAEEVSAAKYHQNVSDFAVAYGLGVQLLSEAKIESNLLPQSVARSMAWARKSKVFIAAASLILVVMLLSVVRAGYDNSQWKKNEAERRDIKNAMSSAKTAGSKLKEQQSRDTVIDERISKQVDFYDHREVVPKLIENIVMCLPDSENNPEQLELYNAFNRGDVEVLKNVPRNERKQLFVTNLSVSFAKSLLEAKWKEKSGKGKRRTRNMDQQMDNMMMPGMMPGMGGPGMGGPGMGGPGMGGPGMGGPGMGGSGMGMMPGMGGMRRQGVVEEEEEEIDDSSGFLVVIEGYSPYENIGDLLDPADVGDDQAKWGLITRLANFAKIHGEDFPYELFEKTNIDHFKQESDPVDIEDDSMPVGIGLEKELSRVPLEQEDDNVRKPKPRIGGVMALGRRNTGRVERELVLVDPMTNEEMSKTLDLYTAEDVERENRPLRDIGTRKLDEFSGEEKFIVRDHWFRIRFKIKWKDAPDLSEEVAGVGAYSNI